MASAISDVILRAPLTVAHHLDRWEQRARRLVEKWGWPQAWLQEFCAFLPNPRMTMEEFHVRYTLKRMAAEPLLDHPMTEAEALNFYQTNDYMLWRNVVHRRHTPWRKVLATMGAWTGSLLEFGCGTAPVTTWVMRRRPDWRYAIEDLDGPAFRYARWRVTRRTRHAPAPPEMPFDVITALDVFEHLADPEKAARALVQRLASGGFLHQNFVSNPKRNDLDLASEEQRDATLAYLHSALELVWQKEGYWLLRKPGRE